MIYFTPKRYVRLQSGDTAIAEAAEKEWEQAEANYLAYFQANRHRLPPSVQTLHDQVLLHDALVLGMWSQETEGSAAGTFTILLQPETPTNQVVQLTYQLLAEPQMVEDALQAEYCSSAMVWLYDEFDEEFGPGTFTHRILFSSGEQLTLRARDLHVVRGSAIYLPSGSHKVA
jgi:hypothetical protein